MGHREARTMYFAGLAVLLFVVLFVVCVATSGGLERRASKAGRKRSSTAAKLAAEKKAAAEKCASGRQMTVSGREQVKRRSEHGEGVIARCSRQHNA